MLDDELVIETPERVELHYVLANVGNRFLAAAIDHLIQLVGVIIVVLIAGSLTNWNLLEGVGGWTAAIAVFAVFALYWGYFVFFETIWSGQTPGKRIMKLRVVREDGRPVRFFEIFIRNLIRVALDIQPTFSYAVGVISIIFSPRSKRLGDFVAGTVVVKERSTEAPSLEEIIKISDIEQQRVERVAAAIIPVNPRSLTDQEVRAIETFLKRRFELAEPNRTALAVRIVQPIAIKLGIAYQQHPPETLLEEIDRQYKAQTRYSD
jgi:uncharacterized RDD family membrane protein YckC